MNDSIKSILSYVSLGCGALGALLVFLCGILTCALPKVGDDGIELRWTFVLVVIGFVLAIVGCVAGVLSISKGQDMSTINICTKIGILTSVVAILFFLTSCTYVCGFKGGVEDGVKHAYKKAFSDFSSYLN
ncbi:MAG: hypothetical protein IIT65_06475 [Lachnospiraceae bacterium]|jgi:hypothetical protein|nr:hypothetical protein [Lachnospiraceae bacterium]